MKLIQIWYDLKEWNIHVFNIFFDSNSNIIWLKNIGNIHILYIFSNSNENSLNIISVQIRLILIWYKFKRD